MNITLTEGAIDLDLALLDPDPTNPRTDLGDLTGLIESIQQNGIIEPPIVTADGDGRYIIVAGHRRTAAALAAGLTSTLCIVRPHTLAERASVHLVENLHREGLTPLDEAAAYQQLADLGLSQRQIADKVGVSQPHVNRRLKLDRLPQAGRDLLVAGRITVRQAETLVDLPDGDIDQVVETVAGRASNYEGQVPDWTVGDAIKKLDTARKHAVALGEGEGSGLVQLQRQPYAGAGDFEPCAKRVATHWYLGVDGVKVLWAKARELTTKTTSTTSADAPCISAAEHTAAREARKDLLRDLIENGEHTLLRQHGLARAMEELLTDSYLELTRRDVAALGPDVAADLSDDPALLLAVAALAKAANFDDLEHDPAVAAGHEVEERAMWVALGYELQWWEQNPDAADEMDAA